MTTPVAGEVFADPAFLRDPSNWGLWTTYQGAEGPGISGLVVTLAVSSWIFGRLSCRMNFAQEFYWQNNDERDVLRDSAQRLYSIGRALPAFLAFTIFVLSGFAWWGIAFAGAIWLGGGTWLMRHADRVPVIGEGATLAIAKRSPWKVAQGWRRNDR